MKGSLHLGKIAGIKVSIHWSFLLLLIWAFYSSYKDSQQIGAGLWSVLFILTLFLCVVLHEFGHALTAKRYGIQTESITLLPIGGVASIKKMPEKPGQELAVALAGPLVNVVIAGILFVVFLAKGALPNFNDLNTALDSHNFLTQLLLSNIALVLFNLVPAFPMDGGRVLRAILAFYYDRTKATRIASRIGQVLAILFIWFGFLYNFWLVIIGLFIFGSAGLEYRYESTASILKNFKVRQALMHRYTLLHSNDTISKAAEVLLNGTEKNFLVFEGDVLFGVLSRNDIIRGLKEYGNEAPLSGVAQQRYVTASPEDNLDDCYMRMLEAHLEICPVVEGEKLLGVIDTENISELLLLAAAGKKDAHSGEKAFTRVQTV